MTRGKCQACGVYASLEAVRLAVSGRTVYEGDLCRRCGCEVEDAVRDAVRLSRVWTR